MGTEISLDVSGMTMCWSKNSLGIDHGGLFQSGDHYTAPPTAEEVDEGGDFNEPDSILFRTILRKPLGQIVHRLDLLGFTLENAEKEYNLMVKKLTIENDEFEKFYPEYAKPKVELMRFPEFINFIKNVNLKDLDSGFVNEDAPEKEKRLIRGRFTNEHLLRSIPHYTNDFDNAWSEKSAFGSLVNILHPYSVIRLLAENKNNSGEFVTWDYGALVSNGWANLKDIETNTRRHDKFLIATEGSSDSLILQKALRLLRHDIEDFFHFIDMKSGHPFPGTGNLIKFADGLVKIDIQNRIVFVLDNDCEGIEAYNKIRELALPQNINCVHLPDLPDFNEFPAIGPHGITKENINGRAVAIECYLDLTYSNYDEAKIRWSNYKKESDAYQGALENKDYYTKRFMKLNKGSKAYESYDFSKISIVLNELIKACSKISSDIRSKQLDDQYPD